MVYLEGHPFEVMLPVSAFLRGFAPRRYHQRTKALTDQAHSKDSEISALQVYSETITLSPNGHSPRARARTK